MALVDPDRSERVSKLLSLILRHRPGDFGVTLDADGWTDLAPLVAAVARSGTVLSRDEIEHVVRSSDKQRFALSPDGTRIRAQQGHSVPVELGHPEATPPEVLFHGTVERFLPSVRREGITPRGRHHVHLSSSVEAATSVGDRRGHAIVLRIRSGEMSSAGARFFLTPNGVWLTDRVDPAYIVFPE